jgi:hypothetical protein
MVPMEGLIRSPVLASLQRRPFAPALGPNRCTNVAGFLEHTVVVKSRNDSSEIGQRRLTAGERIALPNAPQPGPIPVLCLGATTVNEMKDGLVGSCACR